MWDRGKWHRAGGGDTGQSRCHGTGVGERVELGDKAETSVRTRAADSCAQCCSQCPSILVSRYPNVLVFRCPNVLICRCPSVPVSRYPGVPMFLYPDVLLS